MTETPRQTNRAVRIIFIVAVVLLVIAASLHFNVIVFLLSLVSLTGAFICGLAVLRSIDKNDPLSAKWCDTAGRFDCDKVLKSVVFSKYIYAGDIGLIYFSGVYLFLLLSSITNQCALALEVLTLPSFLAFATSLASLWYQWRVIKSWCKICLMVAAVIWLQTIVVGQAALNTLFHPQECMPAAALLLVSLLLTAAWLFIKPVIVRADQANAIRKQLRTWKRNPEMFIALQKQQPGIDVSSWQGDFILGAPEAPVQIMAAMSLYCKGCINEYRRLERLLHLSRQHVAVTIRFKHIADKNPGNTMALQYILRKYAEAGTQEEKQKILRVWFANRDLGKCRRELGNIVSAGNCEELLQQNERWFSDNKITRTPTVFVNGHQLAELYRITDLIPLMTRLRSLISTLQAAKSNP
jgi:protein-disulfide isomerase